VTTPPPQPRQPPQPVYTPAREYLAIETHPPSPTTTYAPPSPRYAPPSPTPPSPSPSSDSSEADPIEVQEVQALGAFVDDLPALQQENRRLKEEFQQENRRLKEEYRKKLWDNYLTHLLHKRQDGQA
jgi:hypothetical protein